MLVRKELPDRPPLAERTPATKFYSSSIDDPSPGRRLRVFACLAPIWDKTPLGELMEREEREHPNLYTNISLYELLGNGAVATYGLMGDPSLHQALQDLGNEINEDIHEACAAFDNPDLHYPGSFDPAIPPVPNDHVAVVIAALQRELNRELRTPAGGMMGQKLPAVPLAELPFRIQRALVERRRRRFYQYGITIEKWQTGKWSVWDVPLDPEWIPRRERRIFGL